MNSSCCNCPIQEFFVDGEKYFYAPLAQEFWKYDERTRSWKLLEHLSWDKIEALYNAIPNKEGLRLEKNAYRWPTMVREYYPITR